MLSFLLDSAEIAQLRFITENTDKSDGNLSDGIRDIEASKVNLKKVATA